MADYYADGNFPYASTNFLNEIGAAPDYMSSDDEEFSDQPQSFSIPSQDLSNNIPFTTQDAMDRTALLTGKARKQKGSSSRGSSNGADPQAAPTGFDPRALLNPQAAAKRARDGSEAKADVSQAVFDESENNSNVGMAAMIENMHGVGKREMQPQKKRKLDREDEEDRKKGKGQFTGGAKGGVIGDYMRQKREEGQAEAGPPPLPVANGVVDLTADDDDDVQIIGSNAPDPGQEVCLGMLNTKILAYRIPSATNAVLDRLNQTGLWPACKINLTQEPGQPMKINTVDRNGNQFGTLDLKVASALAPLMVGRHIHKMRLQGVLVARKRTAEQQPGDMISEMYDCQIYVYAPRKHVEGIGRNLSHKQVFLYNPANPEMNKEVVNPHVPKTEFIPRSTGLARPPQYQSSVYTTRTVEEIRSDVQTMFDTLASAENLPEMEPDMSYLKTELMAHQKQALYFLTRQESQKVLDASSADGQNPMWKSTLKKDKSRMWYNVITGHEVKTLKPALGGLFADLMGLGKTLSILSRICATVKEARKFGDDPLPDELLETTAERNTRATLIVCPKSVLSNWDEQIKAHLETKKIAYYGYHGSNRVQDLDELDQYDIIITSYTTVATEFSYANSKFKALGKMNWFRIVLDEAHMIRNQSTGTFKATRALHSKRRWAVTGTPIQNHLNDLGALIKFVGVYPFSEQGVWEQYMLAPFKSGDVQILDNLRLLVDSISLRRGKEKISLPARYENVTRLQFSESERALYEAFAKDARNKNDALIRNHNTTGGRVYAHVLASITRLRLICAHGKDLLSADDLRTLEGQTFATAIDLGDEDEDEPALSEDQVYSMFYLLRESNMNSCSRCMKEIAPVTYERIDDDPNKSDLLGYMTPCYQVICPDCIGEFETEVEAKKTRDNYVTCPICEQYIKCSFAPMTQTKLDADIERRNNTRLKSKNDNTYGGPHTKVKALVEDLLRHQAWSEAHPDEAPVRSVVFSGWTQYLDLIEIALNDANITFLRLDGKMSVAARSHVLAQFRTDPAVTCILVSIKAGGQGLNFTAASKVYMMEPQFNPGVEMQAIDRVHRLGQDREVTIVKYCMVDSFEEKVMELQKKKLDLAATAMQRGKLSRGDAAKKKLEDLRSLFR